MSEQLRPRRQIHRLELEPGEWWWGGAVGRRQAMPFGARAPARPRDATPASSMTRRAGANQSAPLLVSSAGRYVWSDGPFVFAFDGAGGLEVAGGRHRRPGRRAPDAGRRLPVRGARPLPRRGPTPARDVHGAAVQHLDRMPYAPTQEGCSTTRGRARRRVPARGAHDRRPLVGGLRRLALRPGPLPRPGRDDHAAARLGLRGDAVARAVRQPGQRELPHRRQARLAGPRAGRQARRPRVVERLQHRARPTHPNAVGWLRGELDALGRSGSTASSSTRATCTTTARPTYARGQRLGPTAQCEAWARLAAEYPYNELRACWKSGGQPLAQRLHDKPRRGAPTDSGH